MMRLKVSVFSQVHNSVCVWCPLTCTTYCKMVINITYVHTGFMTLADKVEDNKIEDNS